MRFLLDNLLPPEADAVFAISDAPNAESSAAYESAPGAVPFPTVVNFIPKAEDRPSPWLRRLEVHWDPKLAVAFRARWNEVGGSWTIVDLYDIKLDEPVEDAAFVPPDRPADPAGRGEPAQGSQHRRRRVRVLGAAADREVRSRVRGQRQRPAHTGEHQRGATVRYFDIESPKVGFVD